MPRARSTTSSSHPAAVFNIAANTMHYQIGLYLESFVGRLGWLDVILPPPYVELAWAVLIAAAYASVVTGVVTRARCYAGAVVALALASSVVALFAALYVSWTPVGNFIVDGIQGRYFIPLAFFAPALCPFGARPAFGGQPEVAELGHCGFPGLLDRSRHFKHRSPLL